MSSKKLFPLVLSAMFLALALVLPFLTGQIPQIGRALCPMHFPALLCGFFCGSLWGCAVGFIAPLLRFVLLNTLSNPLAGIAMCFEMAAYGFAAGWLYRRLPKTTPAIYGSLLGAMLLGRLVWGCVSVILYGLSGSAFGWTAFLSGAVLNAIPGIVAQIVLIPPIVLALKRYTVKKE